MARRACSEPVRALLSKRLHRSSSLRPSHPSYSKKMGNSITACHVTNYGKRTIRVFVTKQPLAIDDVLTSESKGDEHSSVDKTFSFKSDVNCVRILPSLGKEVHYEPQDFMNVFVEDEEQEDVCCKHIMHNMVMKAPFAVLLYDA